jgi:carbamoyltransferase
VILGIYQPAHGVGHDTGVALVDRQGRILAALSEERLSRVKMDGGFPFRALEMVLRMTGARVSDLDAVAVPFMDGSSALVEGARLLTAGLTQPSLFLGQYRTRTGRDAFQAGMRALGAYEYTAELKRRVQAVRDADRRPPVVDWRDFLKVAGLGAVPLVQMDHHVAHAAGAYWMSGWNDALVMTCDGVGSLKSSIVARGRDGALDIVGRTFYPNSPGEFWEAVTVLCGFHHMKHGGKITGLAAHGDERASCYEILKRVLWADGTSFRTEIDPVALARELAGVSREDLAATAQRRLIEVVVEVVRAALEQTGLRKIALAGGVFANVRLNQAIAALPQVDEIFVCPAMGDEGLGAGAALWTAGQRYGVKPQRVPHMYYGPEYPESDMQAALASHGLSAQRLEDRELGEQVAERIANGRVVAVCRGRMELGPRALGHRTILYRTGDPSVNEWLNKRLVRTEFMPFAPVTLAEHADACYAGLDKCRYAAEFMTITCDCSTEMKRVSPAVVHLDGTARPQLIRREIDAFYYDTLSAYHRRTGVPSLVNTSFNMHEEPIVCTPDDAVRAFMQGHLDTLALGPFLVDAPGERSHEEPR